MNSTNVQASRTRVGFQRALKLISLTGAVIGGSLFSHTAMALCFLDSGSVDREVVPVAVPPIDASAPVGSKLATINLQASGTQADITCTDISTHANLSSDFALHNADTYTTGIDGIGMQLSVTPNDRVFTVPSVYSTGSNNSQIAMNATAAIQMTLIKTGDIPAGGQIAPRTLVRGTTVQHSSFTIINATLSAPLVITLERPTCTVNVPNINVELLDVHFSDFDNSGRAPGKDFSIDLSCAGGTGATNVHVTLTDATQPGNTSSQLSLSPDSQAKGVVLEVTNKHGVVRFGPASKWLDGAASAGSYSIPLSVNYLKVPGTKKPGSVIAAATYTLDYD